MATIGDVAETLFQGGVAALPTGHGWVAACRPDKPALARLQALAGRSGLGQVGVAFASWDEARLFLEPDAGADAVARSHLPGPLVLRLAGRLDTVPGPLDIHVPGHPAAQRCLREVGPLAVVPLGQVPAWALDGAGLAPARGADCRGPPDVHGPDGTARFAIADAVLSPAPDDEGPPTHVTWQQGRATVLRAGPVDADEVQALLRAALPKAA